MAAKYANWLSSVFNSEAGKAAIPALASVGATAGVYGIQRGIGSLMEARNKAKSYKQMFEMHPHLKDRDSTTVQRVYNSLYRINPGVASDPYVAGAWVHNVVERGSALGADSESQAVIGAVKDLAQVRSHMTEKGPGKGLALHESVGRGVESTLQRIQEGRNLAGQDASQAKRDARDDYRFEKEQRQDKVQKKLDEFHASLAAQARQQQEKERDLKAKETTLGVMEQRHRGPKDFSGGSGI